MSDSTELQSPQYQPNAASSHAWSVSEERSALGDFVYQVGVNVVSGLGIAGVAAGSKAIVGKAFGSASSGDDGDEAR
jgi:hypothetical protein